LNKNFYTEENLKEIFGDFYKIITKNDNNRIIIYLSDLDNKYIDEKEGGCNAAWK